jgi:hypothetical protein
MNVYIYIYIYKQKTIYFKRDSLSRRISGILIFEALSIGLSRSVKVKIHITTILPVVFYEYETWFGRAWTEVV